MLKTTIKTYTLHDLIVHKRAHAHNLTEMCSLFPNQGKGFHVRRTTWPEGEYYEIKDARYKVK